MAVFVSIVIPVYNREHIIKETVECAINQTYKNIEIVICDNKSADRTWEILKELSVSDDRIRILQNDFNVGPVLNWKNCLELVKGEYTKILWSDDLIEPTFIEYSLPLFDKDTAFVLSAYKVFKQSKNNVIIESTCQNKEIYNVEDYFKDILIYDNLSFPLSPGCALFRTYDLVSALMVDIPNTENLDFKKFGAGNDLLLFLITASKYSYIKCVRSFESYFRDHNSSLTTVNDLTTYYEWSKKFFVYKYLQRLIPIYNSQLLYKAIRNKKYRKIYYTANFSINVSFFYRRLISKLKYNL